jgi:hypothetical protein
VRIVFDDEREVAAEPRAQVVDEDDVRAAQRAVRFAELALTEAVAEVQALDGLSGWVSWLTGNHEADVQRALALVQRRRTELQAARGVLEELLDTRRQAEAALAEQAEAEAAEAIELELLADGLRDQGTPQAARLRSLEQRIASARGQAEGFTTVFQLGSAIRGKVKRALGPLDNAKVGHAMDLGDAWIGNGMKLLELRNAGKALEGVDEQLPKLTAACEHVGIELRLGDGAERVRSAHRSSWTDMLFDNMLLDARTGSQIQSAATSLQMLVDDLTLTIDHCVDARKALQQELDELQTARVTLLRSLR